MYGSTPSVMKNKQSALMTAEAFSVEECETWIVVEKDDHVRTWYKPIRYAEAEEAASDGWKPLA